MFGPPPPPLALRRGRFARYDAVVVGSGVGGSVTAALLSAGGLRVLVLEKNQKVGGILASYRRDGFKIDMGSHLIARGAKGPLGTVLRRLGLERPRFLTHSIPVRSRGIFESTAPSTFWGLPRVAAEAARTLRLGAGERRKLLRLIFHLFTLTERELCFWDRQTLDRFIRRYTEHPGAYFLFSFLASIFFVLPPWQVSAGEAIRCLRRLLLDYQLSYVEGGVDSIPHALLGRVIAAGGDVVVGSRVTSVRRRGPRLCVSVDDGTEYEGRAVACNLAPMDLLPLLERNAMPESWSATARAVVPSGNAHQVKLALARPLVDEGCLIGGLTLNGLTVDDLSISLMERTVASIEAGRVSDPIAVYAPVPSNFDPSIAPPGRQLIVASIYGPVRPHPLDPPGLWKERALGALAKVIPGLMDSLLFVEFAPIPAVGGWMGKRSNGAICNGQLPGQVGRDRLPVWTPIEGLFLCGDGAGGRGIGTELAAASAIETERAIHRYLSRVSEPPGVPEAISPETGSGRTCVEESSVAR